MTRPEGDGPRARLLDAARKLFYAQGYHSTGINQLVEEASVAKASFYQHFPSKEDLGAAYLEEEHREWVRAVEAHLAGYESSRDRLLGLFDFLKERKNADEFRGCAFINAVVENPSFDSVMRKVAREHYGVVRQKVAQLVEDALSENGVSSESKADLADAMVLLFQGAIVSSQTYEDVHPILQARKTAARLLTP